MIRRRLRTLVMLLVLPLTATLSGCENPVGNDHEVREATGVVITDLQDNVLLTTEGAGAAGWVGAPLTLQVGQELPVRIFFIDPAGERFQLPPSGAEYTLRVEFTPAGIANYVAQQAEQGVFRGLAPGETHARINIQHGGEAGHPDFQSPPLRIEVS